MVRPAAAGALLALATILFVPALGASPVENSGLGERPFTGPTHPHASSIYISPAAIGLGLSGHAFYAGAEARADRVGVDRALVDPESGETSPGPSVTTHTFSGVGNLAYTYTGPRISGGIALHTPQAASFPSAEPLRYHTLGGYHYQAALSGAGSIEITDYILFGAGLSLVYNWFDLSYDRDAALDRGRDDDGVGGACPGGDPCGLEHPAAAQRHELTLRTGGVGNVFDTRNVALTVSALFRLAEGWWLGASFLQPSGGFDPVALRGSARVTPEPRAGGEPVEGDAELRYHLPQTARVGLRGPVHPDYDLTLGLAWHGASRHDRLDFRLIGPAFEGASAPAWQPRHRGLRDVLRASAGVEGRIARAVEIGARLRVDTGATGASTLSPIQLESPHAAAAGAAAIRVADPVVVTAGYEFTYHRPGTSDPSAFDPVAALDCVDAGYSMDACGPAREGRALPTAAGRYRRLGHAAFVSLRYETL